MPKRADGSPSFEAAGGIIHVPVDDREGLAAGGSKQEIVSAHLVLHDNQHRMPTVGIEQLAGRQVNEGRKRKRAAK